MHIGIFTNFFVCSPDLLIDVIAMTAPLPTFLDFHFSLNINSGMRFNRHLDHSGARIIRYTTYHVQSSWRTSNMNRIFCIKAKCSKVAGS